MSAAPNDRFEMVNPVRERLAAGGVAFGINVRVARSGEIARIARATGHDFLYIDAQHALFNRETVSHLAGTALGCGVAPFVRVRSAQDPDISLLLDAGVTGVVVPDVVSPEQARHVVDVAKYPPLGRRSLAGFTIHADFRAVPTDVQMSVENAGVLVVIMIESRAGLARVEEIAAVPGVDGLYLGMNDMLADMGRPGQLDDPELADALDRVVRAAAAHGQFVGAGGMTQPAQQVRAIRAGVRFMTTDSDLGMLRAGAGNAVGAIRAGLADGPDDAGAAGAGAELPGS